MFHSHTPVAAAAIFVRLAMMIFAALPIRPLAQAVWAGEGVSTAGGSVATATDAGGALHERIDAAVEQVAVGPLAPLCSDADFVRRIYLDLIGVIPTASQVRAFFADDSPNKRASLIDSLIESPEFSRHIAVRIDVLLLDRRPDKYVDQHAWERYLVESVAENKPLDQLFRELVYPDGLGDDVTPARKFLLNRDAEPHAMTRDVGRMLFGMDLQCAQCHDHPLIDDYLQADYYGLYAFLNRTSLFEDPAGKIGKLSERAEGEAAFESVFTGDGRALTRPRVPHGTTLYIEPTFAAEQAYLAKPDKKQAGKPAFSRRHALAQSLADNKAFRRNLANRLWAMVMGRGLVHPSDFHYLDNPPVNPELLALLAADIAENGFDLRYMIRELTLSKTYQRSCQPARPETLNLADIRSRLELLNRQHEARLSEVDRLRDAASATEKAWQSAMEINDRVAEGLPALQEKLTQSRELAERAQADLTTAQQAHQSLLERIEPIQSVLVATRTAKQQVADEPALDDALAILGKRSAELSASAREALDEVQQKVAALDRASQTVGTLQSEVESLLASRTEPDALVRLEQHYLAADSAYRRGDAARRLADAQIALCQAILEYPALVASKTPKAEAVWSSIVERWTLQGQIAALKPLTPEQLALSTMRATGFLQRSETAAKAAVDKKPPPQLNAEELTEPEKARVIQIAVQVEMLNQLRSSVSQFVAQFGGIAGEEFQATVGQALFLGNSPTVNAWLAAGADTLIGRLSRIDEPQQLADELSMAVLSRSATLEEQRQIAAFLAPSTAAPATADTATAAGVDQRPAALAELVWAMITSNEFRFNH